MNRLKDLREDRDLTQKEVGRVVGVAPNSLANYENEKRALNPDLIDKFCDFYGVTADYLLGRSSQPHATVSEMDTELLAAYHSAPEEIRAIIDTALAPYREAKNEETAAAS